MSNEIFFEEILEVKTYASVIIPLALPMVYTWEVPQSLSKDIKIGQRVEVGLRNKKYTGIVQKITNEKPLSYSPKPLLSILDKHPLLYPQQLEFWAWIASYYMCTMGDVMQAALPANLKLSSESTLIWNEMFDEDMYALELSDDAILVAEALEIKKKLTYAAVQDILGKNRIYPILQILIQKNIAQVWEELKEKFSPKIEKFVTLNPLYKDEERLEQLINSWERAPKQLAVLLAFLHLEKTENQVTLSNLLAKADATHSQIAALQEKNILKIEQRKVDRKLGYSKEYPITNIVLTEDQSLALQQIQSILAEQNTCLLHGVTASGKTEVYIALIKTYLSTGKQVLYMLPEIALTTQIVRKLQNHFGADIVIYHSKFNDNERVEIWEKIRTQKVKIVLGARSAIFLPFSNLGLIIVDEEHDTSYKQQDPAPRYNARDAAIFYANLFQAKVLLGSATPSIESYYNALQKKYGLASLEKRYKNIALPTIELIDLKINTGEASNEKTIFSQPLIDAINATLNEKKQVILFQNRRGYSPYLQCKTCGWIPHCHQCDVTLTFHKIKAVLACHYCGNTYPVVTFCAACGGTNFVQKNFGTEKIEDVLNQTFPKANIARMDMDTIKGKNDHQTLIHQFEKQQIDILVGTQMVVKGLDFENVALVGILDGDGILGFTDFRVNERAFQLMEQVSGRAGRKDGNGKVLIQLLQTKHPVLNFLHQHNYPKFYDFEIEGRKQYLYPPFHRIILLTIKHKDNTIAQAAAHHLKRVLFQYYQPFVYGPAQPAVSRIRDKYIWEIQLKLPKNNEYIQGCKAFIIQEIAIIKSQAAFKSVQIMPNVDPS